MDKLRKDIPDYILLPYQIKDSELPTMMDSPSGYADGKEKRRLRREKNRQNKKR